MQVPLARLRRAFNCILMRWCHATRRLLVDKQIRVICQNTNPDVLDGRLLLLLLNNAPYTSSLSRRSKKDRSLPTKAETPPCFLFSVGSHQSRVSTARLLLATPRPPGFVFHCSLGFSAATATVYLWLTASCSFGRWA